MTYSDNIFGVWDDKGVFHQPPYDPLRYGATPTNANQYITATSGWSATFGNTVLPSTLVGKTSIRTVLGAGIYVDTRRYDSSIGLYQIDNVEPTTYPAKQTKAQAKLTDRPARAALPAGAPRKMYFAIDHNWNYQMGGTTTIGISCWYYDSGFNGSTDKLILGYDGQSGTTAHATQRTLGNTKTWKEMTWSVTDAYFGGRLLTLNGASIGDFYLQNPDLADLWINEVIVTQSSNTTSTYYYLVGPSNVSNIQTQLTSRTATVGAVLRGSSRTSATGSYTPSGGQPTTNP